MSKSDKIASITRCYAHHLKSGRSHEQAVAELSTALGLSTDAIHYALRPAIEAAAAAQQLAR
jgi:hypothetical protein